MAGSTLAKTDTGEVQLTITIPKAQVKKAYDEALKEAVKEVIVPGFRKGKAPQNLAEQRIDKSKLYERVLQQIVPQAYTQAIKEHKLAPIISPKVELLKAQEGQDWEFRATTCERPEVKLGDYKDKIKKALAPTKLWTPDKGKPKEGGKPTLEEKTQKVIQALLQEVKFSLPQVLVEEELNRALANLINQTNSMGLTVDQYLTSIGKSTEQIRGEYRARVESDLRLQLTLDEIARKEKIEISQKEIDDLIKATGDEKIRENLNTPLQRAYIKGVLLRRKALDFLAKL